MPKANFSWVASGPPRCACKSLRSLVCFGIAGPKVVLTGPLVWARVLTHCVHLFVRLSAQTFNPEPGLPLALRCLGSLVSLLLGLQKQKGKGRPCSSLQQIQAAGKRCPFVNCLGSAPFEHGSFVSLVSVLRRVPLCI